MWAVSLWQEKLICKGYDMDRLQQQITVQANRIQQSAAEKDILLRQIAQAQARIRELDRVMTESRGVIAGLELARQIQAKQPQPQQASPEQQPAVENAGNDQPDQ